MGRLINTTSMTTDGVIDVGDWVADQATTAPLRRAVHRDTNSKEIRCRN
jgi:hypothetical protein